MNIVLEEGHPVDSHLRPIKIGGQLTSLELANTDNGARIRGDLIVTGQMDTVNVNRIVSSDLYIDDAEIITLVAGDGHIHINSGATTTIDFDTNGATSAGAGMTFHSILDTGDYFRIDTTTHGATTITTVDDDAAAGHLTLAPDGNLIVNAAGEIQFGTSTAGFTAQTGTDAVSIDWGEGNKYHLLLENSSTVTFATNPSKPCNLLLKIAQGNGGSKIVTWAVTSGDIYWAGGGKTDSGKPTLTTTDDDSDIISFYFDGTNYFGVASLDFDTAS